MHLFYSCPVNTPFHVLDVEESKHIINVLRLSKNDYVYIIDGVGGFYKALIIEPNPKECKVEIIEKLDNYHKHPYYLHVAIAPTKNIDRYEWFVEKAVEIGIDEITPIICERSERKIVKQDRIEKLAIAAMKQSLNPYLPKINDIVSFDSFIKIPFNGKKCIAHCIEQNKKLLQHVIKPKENALILIGAEGDFSKTEINTALTANYEAVSLGDSRLRTETAGVTACHTIALINQGL